MNKLKCDGLDCDTCITPYCPNNALEPDEAFNTLLTKKEFEVLNLIARGYSNKQIQEKLAIKYATIKSHLAHIYEKTNFNLLPKTSEASVLRLRLALKYLESEDYLNWNRPQYKRVLEYIKKISDVITNSEDLTLFEAYKLNKKISEKINEVLYGKIHN